jgi:hypothetical protein
MTLAHSLLNQRLRTPRAAAIAGIAFSILLLAFFWLLRRSVPADPNDPGTWLRTDAASVALALNLVPFAGVAFLWFVGVLRDRLGDGEDRFFSTVFFGSALLFLAMLFASAAVLGAIVLIFANEPGRLETPRPSTLLGSLHTIWRTSTRLRWPPSS